MVCPVWNCKFVFNVQSSFVLISGVLIGVGDTVLDSSVLYILSQFC